VSHAVSARLPDGSYSGSGRVLFRLAAILLALLTVACGPVPRPFAPDDKSETQNPLLRLPDHGGVVVVPAAGLPPAQGRALAEAVAQALREHDIPANARIGNPQSLVLDLQVRSVPNGVALAVSLVDRDGTALFDGEHIAGYPQNPDQTAGWMGFAQPLARAIVQAMKPETVIARRLPAILIGTVTGAPGDGGLVLARNLAFHLTRAGLRMADTPGEDTIAVEGLVTIAELGSETRRLAIAWRVTDKAGTELGRVDMQNHVPRASIDRQWSELSFDIAAASADGILDIAERARLRAN
jgi:hypothetical protein